MARIIIVENELEKGISIANQLKKISEENKNIDLDIECICFFCANKEHAQKVLENAKKDSDLKFDVKWLNLLNFNKTLDEYFYCEDDDYIILSNSALKDDGSNGIPRKRVNFRYAINKGRKETGKIFMYSTINSSSPGSIAQILDENALCKLIGSKYIIRVYDFEPLKLFVEENEFFMNRVRKISDNLKLAYKMSN